MSSLFAAGSVTFLEMQATAKSEDRRSALFPEWLWSSV